MQIRHMVIVTTSHFLLVFSQFPRFPSLVSFLFPHFLCLHLTCFPWCSHMITKCMFANMSLCISERRIPMDVVDCPFCFPHIPLIRFILIFMHMHWQYTYTWHLANSHDMSVYILNRLYICLCICVCQSIRIFKGILLYICLSNWLFLSLHHTHTQSIYTYYCKHAARHNHKWVYYRDTRAIHFIGG